MSDKVLDLSAQEHLQPELHGEHAVSKAERDAAFRPSTAGWVARISVPAVIVAVIFSLPMALPYDYQADIVSLAAIYGCVALSMNVLVGYLGQLSLGHQAFFGVGAFASAIVATRWGLPLPLGLLAGAASGALTSVLLGYVALRVRGLYLAIVTLAYGLLAEVSLFQFGFLAQGVPADRPAALADGRVYAYVVLGCLTLLFLLDIRLVKSKAGRAIQAIRDDERVAQSFGINITRYKLLAFIISGTYAGLAGALFGHMLGYVSSENEFNLVLALTFVLMTVVGGLGNRVGVIMGAIVFATLDEILEILHAYVPFFPEVNPVVVPVIGAALLVITLIQFPGGIGQQIQPIQKWVRGGKFDIHAMHEYHGPGGGIVGRP